MLLILPLLSTGSFLLFRYRSHNLGNTRRSVFSRPLLQPQFNSLPYALAGMRSLVPPSHPNSRWWKGMLIKMWSVLLLLLLLLPAVPWWVRLQVCLDLWSAAASTSILLRKKLSEGATVLWKIWWEELSCLPALCPPPYRAQHRPTITKQDWRVRGTEG